MKPKYVVYLATVVMVGLLLLGTLTVGLIVGRATANLSASTKPMGSTINDLASALLPNAVCEIPPNSKAIVQYDKKGIHYAMAVLNIHAYGGWIVDTEAVSKTEHRVKNYMDPEKQLLGETELLGFVYWVDPGNEGTVYVKFPRGIDCSIEYIDQR